MRGVAVKTSRPTGCGGCEGVGEIAGQVRNDEGEGWCEGGDDAPATKGRPTGVGRSWGLFVVCDAAFEDGLVLVADDVLSDEFAAAFRVRHLAEHASVGREQTLDGVV